MKTIIFFTKSVSITGGKEKVLSGLCNYLVSTGYAVKIVTYDGSLESFFALNSSIKIETLPLRSAQPKKNLLLKFVELYKDVRAYKNMRQQLTGANTVIATDYLIASVLFLGNKASAKKMVAWEHLSYTVALSTAWAFIRKKVYRSIKYVVTLNREEQSFYKTMGCNSLCIANPVQQQPVVENVAQHIVWVGALTKDKGIDYLLQIGVQLKKRNVQTPIHIYGSGECMEEFSAAITQQALQHILVLKGITKNIAAVYANAALLIVTSKHECFPTVILEAFSFGIPVISFDCPTGPRNIISEGKNGYLIAQGDVTAMAEKIKSSLMEKQTLKAMGNAAYETACNYNPAIIYPQWLKVTG